ncbi:MAG: DUF4325 domain-containing protein [Pseudomonadota bacterium]
MNAPPTNVRRQIVQLLRRNGPATGARLARKLRVSRQAVHKHLKSLVTESAVVRTGATRGARFEIRTAGTRPKPAKEFRRSYRLAGLEEGEVFRTISQALSLERMLSRPALNIVHFAFTEMLNNAIDHSRSKTCTVAFSLEPYEVRFFVRDRGIGIFHSVASRFHLGSEEAAVGELTKGKITTMKERHSGEGIFFTSKAADLLSFRSHRLSMTFDALRKDTFFREGRFFEGTEVSFTLRRNSKRQLERVFSEFAPEEFDFKFERTRVAVHLFGSEFVSRSEARRLLARLDRFREIELDFRGVRILGQGFADELFRVFPADHPAIRIRLVNLRTKLAAVVRHVVDDDSWKRLTIG